MTKIEKSNSFTNKGIIHLYLRPNAIAMPYLFKIFKIDIFDMVDVIEMAIFEEVHFQT